MTPTEGVPVVRVVCDLCDGTGTITIVEDYDFEGKSIYAPDECPECEGRLYVERTLYVDAAHPAAASAEREALLDTVDALLDAVRKFVKKDTPTGLMRLNDAMVAAREAVAAARATKEV